MINVFRSVSNTAPQMKILTFEKPGIPAIFRRSIWLL